MTIEHDNIANVAGRDMIAWAGDRPWHRKGTKVPGLMTVIQALVAGGLDSRVVKLRAGVLDDDYLDFHGIQIPNTFATGRIIEKEDGSTTFIPFEGSVKGRYTIVQDADAFDFFNKAIHDGVACIETVGALGNGETVWAMAKLPTDFEVVPGDPIQRYILLKNTHDGSGSLEACFTPVRVVCWNTLTAAIAGATCRVKIRHTKSAKAKVANLHRLLNASEEYWTRLSDAYKALTMRDMTQLEVVDFIEKMFPGKREKVKKDGKEIEVEVVSTRTKNNRDAVQALFAGDAKGSSLAGQTQYGMFNAYTEWLGQHRSLRGNTDPWEADNFGSGVNLRQKAYNILSEQVS